MAGVSIRCRDVVARFGAAALLDRPRQPDVLRLIVMPRLRSMSIRSRYWARIERSSTTPVSCSIRSASVDLPWSMWAMMQKLRICAGAVNV